jgi:hypothetical protein
MIVEVAAHPVLAINNIDAQVDREGGRLMTSPSRTFPEHTFCLRNLSQNVDLNHSDQRIFVLRYDPIIGWIIK